jgi:ribose 5-phosphate isomerase B
MTSNTTQFLHFGADHAGFELKTLLLDKAIRLGYTTADHGTHSAESVDYPDFAHAVAASTAREPGTLGVLICGSGNGVCMSANHHHGIRAALAWNPEIARLAVEHNNANVLCLPARYLTNLEAVATLEAFLHATFEGGRHQRRVEKIDPPEHHPNA